MIKKKSVPTDPRKRTCVIASTRSWNEKMGGALSLRTGYEFVLISDPIQLNLANLAAINPDFVFFPHWSDRIEFEIYQQFECVIFHMTDLPFGRGGSPLQNLIARGIYETKISALRCVEEIDAGPIYLKKPLSLHGSAEEIFLRASNVIESMIEEILQNQSEPTPQDGTPTVFRRRQPEDGDLGTVQSLVQAFDMIRMLDAAGYPSAFLNMGDFKIEFSRASLKSGEVIADVRISLRDLSKERHMR